MKLTVNSDPALHDCLGKIRAAYKAGKALEVEINDGSRRTLTQNRALHLWLSMLADTLNDAGLDMRLVIKPDVDIPWSKESCKEHLWRPIQRALTGRGSTTECKKVEYQEVQEVLVRHLQGKFGVTCPPWPNREAVNGSD